ncbi:pentapeptide repeat-containing protein [Paenibacillus radicis (ex Gao et al. 2016)]|uniref:Pentapeptide repeat-containing protein n=1 Tax=Paenibacillus radicis (ex Gao et al. 2016) TaxID=1737354 RepID=A0A917LY43_9BACL|nr:pentapeptide repeat-containing protein [Paenibacillus radicis (ex Gao et al. 2016)]GGG64697.1 hypothetical protein GCM10010918_18530 [Paenibacillus radicis (ex Gao et al. 2016)]
MNKKQLIARWEPAQIAAVNKALAAVTGKQNLHKKDRSFPLSPYGQTADGLEDFRGVVLTESMQYLTVQNLDLSYAVFEPGGGLIYSTFTNCHFDGVKLDGRFITKIFKHCSFHKAILKNAAFGEQFEDCDFTGSNLSHTKGRDVSFLRCRFSDASFRGAHLMYCKFEGCLFAGAKMDNGSLAGSRFLGESQHLPDWGTMITEHVKVNGEALVLDPSREI